VNTDILKTLVKNMSRLTIGTSFTEMFVANYWPSPFSVLFLKSETFWGIFGPIVFRRGCFGCCYTHVRMAYVRFKGQLSEKRVHRRRGKSPIDIHCIGVNEFPTR
jgi:hypothetical protein